MAAAKIIKITISNSKICYKNNKNYYLKTKISYENKKLLFLTVKISHFELSQLYYKNNKFSYKKSKVYNSILHNKEVKS